MDERLLVFFKKQLFRIFIMKKVVEASVYNGSNCYGLSSTSTMLES